jgi:hypothetical protein
MGSVNKLETGNELEGINKSIFEWAIQSNLISTLYCVDEDFKAKLGTALGKDVREQCTASIELCERIWSKFPELGACPNFSLLNTAEHDRKFYAGYRDHTAHSFKVYLLGLWIYEKNDEIHKAFDKTQFVVTWTATALWHDIGYLFENDEVGKRDAWWTYIQSGINAQYLCPLSSVVTIKPLLSSAEEQQFYSDNRIELPKLTTIASIEDHVFFSHLESAGKASGLTKVDGSIEQFYYYIKSESTTGGKRKPYRDHGVFGALLLLKLWFRYADLLSDILQKQKLADSKIKFDSDVEEKITELYDNVTSSIPIITMAAQAIALHNFTKNDWPKNELIVKGIDIERFYIDLDDTKAKYRAQPFAFLLKLVDELQMWDRTKFDAPKPDEILLHGRDMCIDVNYDCIGIWFRKDDDSYKVLEHPNSEYSVLKKNLSHCRPIDKFLKPLRASQVPSLIEIDPTKTELVFIFHSDSAKEFMTQIKDRYQCKEVRVLLYNRTEHEFEFLQPNGSGKVVTDNHMLEFAKDNYSMQMSDIFTDVHNKKTGFALISTYVGLIGFLVLNDIPKNICEELLADRAQISRLNDYGVMYGSLVIKKFQKLVERDNVLGNLKNADELRCKINEYIPLGYNDCISIFLDIRGLSKLLSDTDKMLVQRSLDFINKFSTSVQEICETRFGIISSHFGGGMLINFNHVYREDIPLSCIRAICTMHRIRKKFTAIAESVFLETELREILGKIDIGMGASVGEIFFSTLGYNTCVFYTGVGEDIGFAKKIENISGRKTVIIEDAIESEGADPTCKGKIFVSEFVYKHCREFVCESCSDVEKWVQLNPVTVQVTNDKKRRLYHVGHINEDKCPLSIEHKCSCCVG